MKLFTRLLLSLLIACPAAAFAAPVPLTLKAEEGWVLAAQEQPSSNDKYLILLHDLAKTKESWNTFAQAASAAGYGTLAIDLRGHGGSTNIKEQKDFAKTGLGNEFNQMSRDVEAAIAYLTRKGIASRNIYLIGAGLGAWGVINLLEGYGNDNPGAKSQGIKHVLPN